MAVEIPMEPSNANYKVGVTINAFHVTFVFRFNSRDGIPKSKGGPGGAWYFDIVADDNTPVATNVKLVLGANLGATFMHAFFDGRVLRAIDTSRPMGQGKDAGFDDAGRRVKLISINLADPFGV